MNFARAGSTFGRPGARFTHFRRADASGSILVSHVAPLPRSLLPNRVSVPHQTFGDPSSHRPHGPDDASRSGGVRALL